MTNPTKENRQFACFPAKPKSDHIIYIHSVIGIAIMILFYLLPPISPITPVGMRIVGAFLGMVYLWSMVDSMWPSILGLLFMGFSGLAGKGAVGMKVTMLQAFGHDTVLLILFSMVLFGAIQELGCTQYVTKWFLTRRVITGRPYVFLFIFYMACFALAALITPIGSLLVLWPIALSLMDDMDIDQCDEFWPYFFVGMFFVSTIGQPFLPFKGAQLLVISAFQKMSNIMVSYAAYMFLNFIMTILLTLTYILILKFIIRPDISKVKAVDAEVIARTQVLPPMNLQQKVFMFVLPAYIILLLAPGFLPKHWPIISKLNDLGPLGVILLFVILFSIWRFRGSSLLDFKEVAYGQLSWGIFFMIAAAIYGANALSDDKTGVKEFLLTALNPILGGRSEMVFVAIMFTVALIITNFANNAAMAVVLMPVILAFTQQMGLSPTPVAIGVGMMVFVAMLTPAASPHAGMMHGRKDIYTTKDIMYIGFPLCILSLIYYIFIGYPLAKIIF